MTFDNDFARLSGLEPARDDLVVTRRHLHAHPELSFEEAETARYVADKLEGWGYEVARNVGGHGVVGRLTVGAGPAQRRDPGRHGRASHHRADGPAVCEPGAGQDARLRPRRAYDHAARRG